MICALFIGEANSENEASRITNRYKNCPYIYFLAKKHLKVYGIFLLPQSKRWWVEYIEKFPGKETLGLEKISIAYLDEIKYPNSIKKQLPEKPLEISPCGSDCGNCPQNEKCSCCPATIYYKAK